MLKAGLQPVFAHELLHRNHAGVNGVAVIGDAAAANAGDRVGGAQAGDAAFGAAKEVDYLRREIPTGGVAVHLSAAETDGAHRAQLEVEDGGGAQQKVVIEGHGERPSVVGIDRLEGGEPTAAGAELGKLGDRKVAIMLG